jgi:hypothetical protein
VTGGPSTQSTVVAEASDPAVPAWLIRSKQSSQAITGENLRQGDDSIGTESADRFGKGPQFGDSRSVDRHLQSGLPDMKWINRQLPIKEVAGALELRIDGNMIHCWHDANHQHGDRTASVGIRRANNTVKCFGNECNSKPMGPIDLVADVLGVKPSAAAVWIADRFKVPSIPKGRHIDQALPAGYRVGFEDPLELLTKSGLWALLRPPAQRLLPVLLSLAEPADAKGRRKLKASYSTLQRFSGIGSYSGISEALSQLADIGFLIRPCGTGPKPLVRETNTYTLDPRGDELQELAQYSAGQIRTEIQAEKELRKLKRDNVISLQHRKNGE